MQLSSKHISLWYAALSGQPDVVRKDVTDALLRYAFDGIEPEFDNPVCDALFDALWAAAENLPEEEIVMEKRPGAPRGNRNAKKQPKKQFKTIQNNSGNCFNCFSDGEDKACNELNISGKTIQNNSDNCFNCFSEEKTPLSSPSLSPVPPITPPIIPLTTIGTRAHACTCEEVLPDDGTCSAEAATECPPLTPSRVIDTAAQTDVVEAETEDNTGIETADAPCFSREDILHREKSKQDIQHITLWLTQDINRLRVALSHTGIPPNELVRDEQVRTRAKPFIEEYYYQQFERGKDNISTRGRTDIINHFACWLPRYCSRMTEQNNQQHGEFRNNNPTRAGTGMRPDDFARSFSLGFLSGRGTSG